MVLKPKSTIDKLSSEEFKKLINSSNSRSDVFVKLGLRKSGESFKIISRRIKLENIDVSHFIKGGHTGAKGNNRKFSHDDVYCENSKIRDIRSRVLSDKIMEYKCSKCDIKDYWCNKPLTLELDHENGIKNDNRKQNLRWLCPNCHSQTETFGNKLRFNATMLKLVDSSG
jgi:Zn finger protein HypA/HybF involved in hydrogenase expression